jgi:hypothetical protein
MNFLAAPARRDLDSIDETDAGFPRGSICLRQAGSGVMIGERQHLHLSRRCQRHELARCNRAIGVMAVGVQVDEVEHPAGIIRA